MIKSPISQMLQSLFAPNKDILGAPPSKDEIKAGGNQLIKVLFLDIDGVLNSHKCQVAYGVLPFPDPDSDKGYVDNDWASDPMAAELVTALCGVTGAYIVLSSSWRIGFELEHTRVMLDTLGIAAPVIGKTSQIAGSRGEQIASWIEMFNDPEGRKKLIEQGHLDNEELDVSGDVVIQNYAIVDDDSDMLETQKHHFVQTTFMDGLTCALTIELGKILSDDETFHLNALMGKPSAGQEWEEKFQ